MMFKEMIELADTGRFIYMMDKRLTINPPKEEKTIRINKKSPICDNCWNDVWFQMIFSYMREYCYVLPESLRGRAECYWGVNCNTMRHNLDHAKKYNHMNYQTKFH